MLERYLSDHVPPSTALQVGAPVEGVEHNDRWRLWINATVEPDNANVCYAGARVLLVEDNPTNMIVACGMLEKAGVDILRATDGNEAGPVDGVFTLTQSTAATSDTVVTYTVAGSATILSAPIATK